MITLATTMISNTQSKIIINFHQHILGLMFEHKLASLGAKIVRFNEEDVNLNTSNMGVSNESRL